MLNLTSTHKFMSKTLLEAHIQILSPHIYNVRFFHTVQYFLCKLEQFLCSALKYVIDYSIPPCVLASVVCYQGL